MQDEEGDRGPATPERPPARLGTPSGARAPVRGVAITPSFLLTPPARPGTRSPRTSATETAPTRAPSLSQPGGVARTGAAERPLPMQPMPGAAPPNGLSLTGSLLPPPRVASPAPTPASAAAPAVAQTIRPAPEENPTDKAVADRVADESPAAVQPTLFPPLQAPVARPTGRRKLLIGAAVLAAAAAAAAVATAVLRPRGVQTPPSASVAHPALAAPVTADSPVRSPRGAAGPALGLPNPSLAPADAGRTSPAAGMDASGHVVVAHAPARPKPPRTEADSGAIRVAPDTHPTPLQVSPSTAPGQAISLPTLHAPSTAASTPASAPPVASTPASAPAIAPPRPGPRPNPDAPVDPNAPVVTHRPY